MTKEQEYEIFIRHLLFIVDSDFGRAYLADFAKNHGSMDGGGYSAIKFQNNYEKGYDEEYDWLEKNKVMYFMDAQISPTNEDLNIIVEGYEFYAMLEEVVEVYKKRYPDNAAEADEYMVKIRKIFYPED